VDVLKSAGGMDMKFEGASSKKLIPEKAESKVFTRDSIRTTELLRARGLQISADLG
jgi:hypothetical protein